MLFHVYLHFKSTTSKVPPPLFQDPLQTALLIAFQIWWWWWVCFFSPTPLNFQPFLIRGKECFKWQIKVNLEGKHGEIDERQGTYN